MTSCTTRARSTAARAGPCGRASPRSCAGRRSGPRPTPVPGRPGGSARRTPAAAPRAGSASRPPSARGQVAARQRQDRLDERSALGWPADPAVEDAVELGPPSGPRGPGASADAGGELQRRSAAQKSATGPFGGDATTEPCPTLSVRANADSTASVTGVMSGTCPERRAAAGCPLEWFPGGPTGTGGGQPRGRSPPAPCGKYAAAMAMLRQTVLDSPRAAPGRRVLAPVPRPGLPAGDSCRWLARPTRTARTGWCCATRTAASGWRSSGSTSWPGRAGRCRVPEAAAPGPDRAGHRRPRRRARAGARPRRDPAGRPPGNATRRSRCGSTATGNGTHFLHLRRLDRGAGAGWRGRTGPWSTERSAAADARSRPGLGTMTFGTETDEAGSHAQLDASSRPAAPGRHRRRLLRRRVGGDHRPLARRPARRGAGRVVLATKGRFPMGDDPNDLGLSAGTYPGAGRLAAPARRRDGRPLPGARLGPGDPAGGDAAHARRLRPAGKVRYFGLSNFTGWQVPKAVQLARARGAGPPR